jgi:Spy/CpxP family protein refolding chaperone
MLNQDYKYGGSTVKTKKRIVVGIVALLFTVVTGAGLAMAWGPGGCFGKGFHHGMGKGKVFAEFIIEKMDKEVKELNLTAVQKEQYDKIRDSLKAHISEAMEKRKTHMDEMRVEMAKDVPDIAGLATEFKNNIQDASLAMQAHIDDFSSFYNSLNNEQKKKVASHLREKMAR